MRPILERVLRGDVPDLFRATFTVGDLAAPLPSPLVCDVGSLTITDTENKLSIVGGQLVCAAATAPSGRFRRWQPVWC